MPDLPSGRTRAERWLFWLFAIIGVGAALAIIGLIGMAALFSLGRGGGQPPAQVAAKTASQPMTVQQVEAVWGTGLIAVTIGVGDRANGNPYGVSGRGETERRNLILLDKVSGNNRKLLPDNDRRIVDISFLAAAADTPGSQLNSDMTEVTEAVEVAGPASAPDTKAPPPPMAYYAVAVRQKDGPLQDVLIGSLASGSQAWLLTGIDGIDKMWMISPTRLGMLLRQGMKLQYRVIDVPALRIVTATAVDIG